MMISEQSNRRAFHMYIIDLTSSISNKILIGVKFLFGILKSWVSSRKSYLSAKSIRV